MLENGYNIDNNLVVTIDHIDTAQGRRAAAQLLDNTDATAIIGFNDMVTFGVLQELRARRLLCPTDISVIGYSDVPAAELVAPALTTVAVDHYKMGVEAARMMLEMLNKPDEFAPRSIELPVHLVVRNRQPTLQPAPHAIVRDAAPGVSTQRSDSRSLRGEIAQAKEV